jgi:hypothetical protein
MACQPNEAYFSSSEALVSPNLLPLPTPTTSRKREIYGSGNFCVVDVVVVGLMELLNRVFLARNIAIRLRTGGYQASDKAEKDLETHDWQKRVTREWTTGIGFFCSEQGLQSNNSRQLILACIGTRGLLKDVWPTLFGSVDGTVSVGMGGCVRPELCLYGEPNINCTGAVYWRI